jgi:hypothetical protein
MSATLENVTKKKPESAAEQVAAEELVRRAREQGLSLTGPDGLLKQLTKVVIETALDQELTGHLGSFMVDGAALLALRGSGAVKRRSCRALRTIMPRSGRTSARSRARYARVSTEATCSCATSPGLMLQRLVRPGVEDQWLKLGPVYQRDDLTQHDHVITGAVRLLQSAVERRRGPGQDRTAGYAWFEGHTVEHRRAGRTMPVSEPGRDALLPGGQHIDAERPGPLDQAHGTTGLIKADQHQHRVQRHRREGVDCHAMHVTVAAGHGDDGDPCRERAHRHTEGAHVDGRHIGRIHGHSLRVVSEGQRAAGEVAGDGARGGGA